MKREDIDIRHPHTCKCGKTYFRFTTLQNKCVTCLAKKGSEIVRKEARKAYRAQKEKLKTKSDHIKEVRSEFHRYVRMRDLQAGHSCICCDRPLHGGAVGGDFDAGHFRSVGSAPHLRFDERNVHAQTKYCNRWKGGRYAEYEKGLISRIGFEEVQKLKADQEPRHYTIEELKALKQMYREKTRVLQKEMS